MASTLAVPLKRRYLTDLPSRWGKSPFKRPAALNISDTCFLSFTWTKLPIMPPHSKPTVPYLTISPMRGSAPRTVSRTSSMTGLSGCSSCANQVSTSGLWVIQSLLPAGHLEQADPDVREPTSAEWTEFERICRCSWHAAELSLAAPARGSVSLQ